MAENQSSLAVAIEGKILLVETLEDGTVEEHELSRVACEKVINHLIQTLVIATEDLICESENKTVLETDKEDSTV